MKTNYDYSMPPPLEWKLSVRSETSPFAVEPSQHRHDKWLLILLGSLVYRENPFFCLCTVGMINSSNVASALAPDIRSWSLASKEGLNWVMPPPCAADLHFIYRTCLCTSPFCVGIMSQRESAVCEYIIVFSIVFSLLFLVTLDSPACTLLRDDYSDSSST